MKKPAPEITVRVTPEIIAQASAKVRFAGKDKDGRPFYSATSEMNPVVLAIRNRLEHQPAGKLRIAHWTGFVRIGERTFAVPPIVDRHEHDFLKSGTCAAYEFKLSNEPVPVQEDLL